MTSAIIFPGRYLQGYNAIQRLGLEISRLGKSGFLICSPFVYKNLVPNFKEEIRKQVTAVVEKFGGECSDEEIKRLSHLAKQDNCEVVVGLGGGKTLDTAKAVAHELKVPVIIVPTVASTDAPCSALSVIYSPQGKFKRALILPRNPDLVLVDTKIIAEAPVRYIVAGMGDALATWFEAESCKITKASNMTRYTGSMTAYALARLCYETLLEYGLAAKQACEANTVAPAVDYIIEATILLSGIGFESGGLATAHAIFNGLELLEDTHGYLHGELVAFGTLVSLFLTNKPEDIIDKVYGFCESVVLPTTLADIGLSVVSDADLAKVAEAACVARSPIHNEPIPVTTERVLAAIKAADAEGRRRKSA